MVPTPFKVTFYVATPIILPFSTTLDGLLASAVASLTGITEGEALLTEIPLVRDSESGIFHGSTLFMAGRVVYQQMTKNRGLRSDDDLDARNIQPKRKKNGALAKTPYPKMEFGKGDYAHRLTSFHTAQVPTVIGYGCGDVETVRAHLEIVQGLGRHAQQGCGEIRQFHIETLDDDLSLIDQEGHPQRQLPISLWERLGGQGEPLKGMMAVAPPYWGQPLVECVLPREPEIV